MISVLDRRLLLFIALCTVYFAEAKWTKWTKYSACSRSCGVGIKYRERSCLTQRCNGKNIFYKLCNKQDCGLDAQDFRAAQCEDFNGVPLDGDYYRWIPYYGHGETCELLCYPEGHEFYHKLTGRVVDGTHCSQDSSRICVVGVCKSIGCNKQLGSTLRVDACGLCGGDNSTCSPSDAEMGYFQISNLSPGHTTIVELPVGATDIYLRELGENRNPILLWDSSGDSFALDSETRPSMLRINLAGTKFTYTPHSAGNTEGSLAAQGPTNKLITVYMINEGYDNPGIQYGYTNPKSRKAQKLRTSPVDITHEVVDRHKTPGITLDKTVDKKIQRTNERYSKPVVNRIIASGNVRVKTGHEGELYHRSEDLMVDGRREPLNRSNVSHYLTNHARYMWSSGDWTTCSSGCGEGFQRRGVSCVDRVQRQLTDSSNCDPDLVPASSQPCNNGDCEPESHRSYVSWQPADWGECSTMCELGIQSQHVFCEAVLSDGTSTHVDDEICLNQYKAKPQYRRSCNDDVACAMWKMSPWSRCSTTCGPGRQQRMVVCRSKSDSHRRLNDNACDASLRPTDVRRCDEAACPIHRVTHPPRRVRQCRNSYYGCCPDGSTAARGTNGRGCRSRGEKSTPLVIGKAKRPRCFKAIKTESLPVRYYANKKAWMTGALMVDWLQWLDRRMKAQGRKILLFVDNAPSHPHTNLDNVKLQFLPANTTSVCQPMDQGIIQTLKLKYRKRQLQHVISEMDSQPLKTGIDLLKEISVLQAIYWISSAWREVASDTIEKCFINSGFGTSAVSDPVSASDDVSEDDYPLIVHKMSKELFGVEFQDLINIDRDFTTCDSDMSDWDRNANDILKDLDGTEDMYAVCETENFHLKDSLKEAVTDVGLQSYMSYKLCMHVVRVTSHQRKVIVPATQLLHKCVLMDIKPELTFISNPPNLVEHG